MTTDCICDGCGAARLNSFLIDPRNWFTMNIGSADRPDELRMRRYFCSWFCLHDWSESVSDEEFVKRSATADAALGPVAI